jgi:hypothetical protein
MRALSAASLAAFSSLSIRLISLRTRLGGDGHKKLVDELGVGCQQDFQMFYLDFYSDASITLPFTLLMSAGMSLSTLLFLTSSIAGTISLTLTMNFQSRILQRLISKSSWDEK